jgi:hypothetical protein
MVITPFEVMQDNSAKRTDSLATIFFGDLPQVCQVDLDAACGANFCDWPFACIGVTCCALRCQCRLTTADNSSVFRVHWRSGGIGHKTCTAKTPCGYFSPLGGNALLATAAVPCLKTPGGTNHLLTKPVGFVTSGGNRVGKNRLKCHPRKISGWHIAAGMDKIKGTD